MRKIGLLFVFVLVFLFAFSQNKPLKNNIDILKSLNKDSLINLGLTILKEKNLPYKINVQDYKITTQINEKEVFVKLNRLIKYKPLGSENCNYIYDISINMLTQGIYPFDSLYNSGIFFELNSIQKKQVEFLKETTVLPYPGFENEVVENENTFDILMTNNTSLVIVSFDKITGEEISELNGHFSTTPPPGFSDN